MTAMKYYGIYNWYLLLLILAGCSMPKETIYRSYKDYYIKEVFYKPGNGAVTSYQAYLLDSFFRKEKRLYFSDHIYNYRRNDSFILRHDRIDGRYKGYHSCLCGIGSSVLNKNDSIFIERIKEVSDSLDWPRVRSLNTIDGFKKN